MFANMTSKTTYQILLHISITGVGRPVWFTGLCSIAISLQSENVVHKVTHSRIYHRIELQRYLNHRDLADCQSY